MRDIVQIAKEAAKRAGYGRRAVEVVFDRRRKYGAKVLRAVGGHRRGGKYVRAFVVVAVPAHWAIPDPQTVTAYKPEIEAVRTKPSRFELSAFRRYNRLIRWNGHSFAFRVSHKVDVGTTTENMLRSMLQRGTLKVDLSQVAKPIETDRELERILQSAQ